MQNAKLEMNYYGIIIHTQVWTVGCSTQTRLTTQVMKLNQMNQSHNPDKQKVGELIMLCYVTISLIYKEKPTIKSLDLTLYIILLVYEYDSV